MPPSDSTNRSTVVIAFLSKYAIIPAVVLLWMTLAWWLPNTEKTVVNGKEIDQRVYGINHFTDQDNQLDVLNQNAPLAITAIGMTLIIVCGGIDLSVGSIWALAGVAAAAAAKGLAGADGTLGTGGVALAVLAGVGAGMLLGALNGLAVTAGRLMPFIVTLATLTVYRGVAYIATDSQPVYNLPEAFRGPGGGTSAGIPNPIYYLAAVFVVFALVLSKTRFGRYLYAIGGNEEAARLSGLPILRIKLAVYVLAGALTGMAGTLAASKLGSGDPRVAQGYELFAIASVVIGGASLSGGKGSVLGTFFGVLFMGYLMNGLVLKNYDYNCQLLVMGLVILGASLADRWLRR